MFGLRGVQYCKSSLMGVCGRQVVIGDIVAHTLWALPDCSRVCPVAGVVLLACCP